MELARFMSRAAARLILVLVGVRSRKEGAAGRAPVVTGVFDFRFAVPLRGGYFAGRTRGARRADPGARRASTRQR
ncbi:Hypothetical Protein RradSPS_3089 (plasmid) [Rubrobacter radiotolerans]|uniref:Uncharacterized protein n=1 Tax=Rubrobacter radiotolerans TaxID=42256 RepID=A0A023X7G1_RUBRA|nr:Hypothetical Protein RradSPS_3089 [Rubrobacter radiotolerans]SMC01574.1 hypothetical protein SAMN00767673_3205 [Rubrobacter radiotolerans DSM 5868]